MTYNGSPGQTMPGWQQQPAGGPSAQVAEPERVRPLVLAGVTVWRALIVVFAIYGFSMATGWTDNFDALSQQASLFTGVVYTFLLLYPLFTQGRRHEPRSPWLRGATTVLMVLVSVTFLTVLGGALDDQPFEHLWTPLVVLADWLFVGRNQANTKWWHPLSWLVFPLVYLVYYLSAGVVLYDFLHPSDGALGGVITGFLIALAALGYLLLGTGKLKAAVRR